MRRRLSFLDDDSQEMGLGSLLGAGGAGGAVGRRPSRGTRFWNPSDSLARQPFHGFPGGRLAWESFKQTGQLPDQAKGLSPQAQTHYYNRIPEEDINQSMASTDPETGMLLDPAQMFLSGGGELRQSASLDYGDQPTGRHGGFDVLGGMTKTPTQEMDLGAGPVTQTPNASFSYEGTPGKEIGFQLYQNAVSPAASQSYYNQYGRPFQNQGRQNANPNNTSPNGSMGPAGDPLGRLLGMR